MKNLFVVVCSLFLLLSCSSENEVITPRSNLIESGTGLFNYTYTQGTIIKTLRVYYHVPNEINSNTRMLFVFHGAGRNASDYRDALINPSNLQNFIVIAPEFSAENFSGGNGYNLGNVFQNGDNPSPETLNNESDWAFSIIEPMFDTIRLQLNYQSNTYDLYGHSAGGQFVHRLLMFKPGVRADKIVASASGWYTTVNNAVSFPHGFRNSPLENLSLQGLFSRKIHIQVGANDDNPNDAGLRRDAQTDIQGNNRRARAIYFFNDAQNRANSLQIPFAWSFREIPNANHDFETASIQAAQFLYNP